jgi:hypothetical protein
MVLLDGSVFVIEAYRWELTEDGYLCTMGGRDFWRYPECEIHERNVGDPYRNLFGGENASDTSNKYNGECLVMDVCEFLRDEHLNLAGWFRDRRRYPQAVDGGAFYPDLIAKYPADFLKRKTAGAPTVANIMSYASEWRMFASWFDVGIRFNFAFDENAGVFTIQPEVYKGESSGVTLRDDGRGVSGFEYSEDGRNAVNAVLASWISAARTFPGTNHKYKGNLFTGATTADADAKNIVNFFNYIAPNEHQSYAERLELYSEKYLDMGTVPPDSDGTRAKMMEWLQSGIEAEEVKPEKSFAFEYDNSGAYRYGEHFRLGDTLIVRSDFLGVASSQRLVTVTTKYDAGAAKSYAFEFGSQRIGNTTAILKKKLIEIDKRTSAAGKKVE